MISGISWSSIISRHPPESILGTWSIQMRQDFFDLQCHRFATGKPMSHMPGMIRKNPWENLHTALGKMMENDGC